MRVSAINLRTNSNRNQKSNNNRQMQDQPSFGMATSRTFQTLIAKENRALVNATALGKGDIGPMLNRIKSHPLCVSYKEESGVFNIFDRNNVNFRPVNTGVEVGDTTETMFEKSITAIANDLKTYDALATNSNDGALRKIEKASAKLEKAEEKLNKKRLDAIEQLNLDQKRAQQLMNEEATLATQRRDLEQQKGEIKDYVKEMKTFFPKNVNVDKDY